MTPISDDADARRDAADGEPGRRVVIPRADHPISRKNIGEEAMRVMTRLNQNGFKAYLVGGAVRDLYLGKQPNDYDIATDARPSRLKKLFRNCRIIGRRFRIAHVFFPNGEVLEVSTFRRAAADASPTSESAPSDTNERTEAKDATTTGDTRRGRGGRHPGVVRAESGIILRDNAYGTPEEDARRRDLTINGLFYDLKTFCVLDYVGGVQDLENRVVRMISDPDLSFREDPVRMIRALRHAARTGFTVEEQTLRSIYRNREDITEANPSRLLEEVLKDLRSGACKPYLESLLETHIIDSLLPRLAAQLRETGHALTGPDHPLWRRIEALDEHIAAGAKPTTPVLLSVLLQTALFSEPKLWVLEAPTPPDIWKHVSANFRESAGAIRVSRRDTERVLQIVIAFRKLGRDLSRGRLSKNLVSKTYLAEALEFLRLDLVSRGESTELADEWLARAEKERSRIESERQGERDDRGQGDADNRPRRRGRRRGRSRNRRQREE